jgi:hypothetical protein
LTGHHRQEAEVSSIGQENGSGLYAPRRRRSRCCGGVDDGSGLALYAGGLFDDAGGAPASHVARWNGSSWSQVGVGTTGTVHALTVFAFCEG